MSGPLICLDAGHGLDTAGKRCLKSIDPEETREWVLNSRIANRVQRMLGEYRCRVMRADDPTGVQDIGLADRVTAARDAGAQVYLSIHHNAGIGGGTGGGIVVYAHARAQEESRRLQKLVYERTVEATGLRGNRSNPTPLADFYVLRRASVPAVLGEFGFMDSRTDTPVILTEEFADGAAAGITEALAEFFGLEKRELTRQEIRELIREEMAAAGQERADRPADGWAKDILVRARARGITDGSRPQAFATRQEVAAMVLAAEQTGG